MSVAAPSPEGMDRLLAAVDALPDRILSVITPAQRTRFWERIDMPGDDQCWEFTGAANVTGYGVIRIGSAESGWRNALTHRVAWTLRNGPILAGLHVCHHCDNPPCCNPAHLFLGTDLDNTRDAIEKGRSRKPPTGSGEKNNYAKLTAADVEEIRRSFIRRYAKNVQGQWRTNARELGAEYGVTSANIRMIVRGVTW